jgi:hypothetical protein
MPIKIVSAAQHAMLQKAASDPDYAKQRGISPDLAREAIEAHTAGGSLKLPDRVEAKAKPPAPPKRPVFLQSRRAD